MPGPSGLASRQANARSSTLTAYRRVDRLREHRDRIEAIKIGATHYLAKPARPRRSSPRSGASMADAGRRCEAEPTPIGRVEWEHIQKVLAEHGGNITRHGESARHAPANVAAEAREASAEG